MPSSGTTPAATRRCAWSSGSPSGSEATSAALRPVRCDAATSASSDGTQSASLQRSPRGRSSTSNVRSKSAAIIAAKVSVMAGALAQMKVW